MTRPWWHFALWLVAPVATVAIVVGVVTWWNAREPENRTTELVKVAEELERCLLGEAGLPDDGVALRLAERTLRGELTDEIQRSCISEAADAAKPFRDAREHARTQPLWDALFEVGRYDACDRISKVRAARRTLEGVDRVAPSCVLAWTELDLDEPDAPATSWHMHEGLLYAAGRDGDQPWIERTRDGRTWESLDVPDDATLVAWRGDAAWATVWVGEDRMAYAPRTAAGWTPGAAATGRESTLAWARTRTGWRLLVGGERLIVRDLDPEMKHAIDTPLWGVFDAANVIVTDRGDVIAVIVKPQAIAMHVMAAGGTAFTDTTIELPGPVSPRLRTCRDGDVVYVVTEGGVVLRSGDLGRTIHKVGAIGDADPALACGDGRLYAGGYTLVRCDASGCAAQAINGKVASLRAAPGGVDLVVNLRLGEYWTESVVAEARDGQPMRIVRVHRPLNDRLSLLAVWLR